MLNDACSLVCVALGLCSQLVCTGVPTRFGGCLHVMSSTQHFLYAEGHPLLLVRAHLVQW